MNENIEQLKKLGKIFNSEKIVTKEDISEVLRGVLSIMTSFKKDNISLNKETISLVESLFEKVSIEHEKLVESVDRKITDIGDIKKEIKSEVSETLSELKKLIKEFSKIKPKDGNDGKDADEELIVQNVLSKVKLPEYEIFSLEEKGYEIIEQINILPLEDDYRIDASHIKNLPVSRSGRGGISNIMGFIEAGTNITLSGSGINGDPYVINASGGGGGGTVTSVGMTVPTGLTVSGSPITTSGTLAVALDTGYVIPLQTTLDGFVPYTGATADVNLGTFDLITDTVRASTSAGLLLESNSGTDIGILGAGGGAGVTWYGNHNFDLATQDTLAGFIGTGKTLSSITIGTGLTLTGTTLSTSAGTITGSGTNTMITYWTGTNTISGSSAFSWNDTTKRFAITNGGTPAKRALQVDAINFEIAMGDTATFVNGTQLLLSDTSQNVQVNGSDGLGTTGSVLDIYTNLATGFGAQVFIGDVSGLVNQTVLEVSDAGLKIEGRGANYRGMRLDFANDILTFGDVGQSTSGGLNVGSIEIGTSGIFTMYGLAADSTIAPFFSITGPGDLYFGDLNGLGTSTTFAILESAQLYDFSNPRFQINSVSYVFPSSQGDQGTALVNTNGTGKLTYENVGRSRFSQTQSVTVAATTTPTSIFGTGQGTRVIAANSLYAGARYEVDIYGYYVADSAQTLGYKLEIMGLSLGPSGLAVFQTATNFAYRAHFTMTVRTTGASGTAIVDGYVKIDKNDGTNLTYELNSTSIHTIDTTASHTTDFIVNWSSSSASNSLTIMEAFISQPR